jgi:ribonuclease HII
MMRMTSMTRTLTGPTAHATCDAGGGEALRVRKSAGARGGAHDTAPYVERLLWSAGLARVAGVDEVGMGPLAGPVVAAAVMFAADTPPLRGIADSKLLAAAAREEAAHAIRAVAIGVGLGVVEPDEIDRLNIYQAGLQAMRRAVAALPFSPDHVVVDARHIPQLEVPQTRYVRADAIVYSVAAASIIAKVHRDAVMQALDATYPAYGFARHVGYATPLHRRSFAPCAAAAARFAI